MAGYESEETIEATMGRFFNIQDLAATEPPDLYALAHEFHDTNADIIKHPLSVVTCLVLEEETTQSRRRRMADIIQRPRNIFTRTIVETTAAHLRGQRVQDQWVANRLVWLGLDTTNAQDSYSWIMSAGNYRYDVDVTPDGEQNTTLYVQDMQGGLLRRANLTDLTAQVMVHKAIGFLGTHPETLSSIEDTSRAKVKNDGRTSGIRAKQDNGEKLSEQEKKALKATHAGVLSAGPWISMRSKVPRLSDRL